MTKTFKDIQGIEEACWVGYKKVGMKKKGDRMVPNCVKEEVVDSLLGKDYVYESVADMYKGQFTKAQLAKMKQTWSTKKASDVDQRTKDFVRNLDQFSQMDIKQANIKYISNLIDEVQKEEVELVNDFKNIIEENEMRSSIRRSEDLKEFNSDQLERLAKAYSVMKGKNISVDNANKLGKMMNGVPDSSLNALRKKKIPFLSGLALSRMIQRKIPVTESALEEDLDKDDKKTIEPIIKQLQKSVTAHGKQAKQLKKDIADETDLSKSQIKKVHKQADDLPKKDFMKRYGKDGDSVRYATATNMVKKKLGLGESNFIKKGELKMNDTYKQRLTSAMEHFNISSLGELNEDDHKIFFTYVEDMKEGLSAAQKKLPAGLQKAILAKQGKKDEMHDMKKKEMKEEDAYDKDDPKQKPKKEDLVGGQKKLDKDKDGDLDAKDFAMLRKGKSEMKSMKKEYGSMMAMKMKKDDKKDVKEMAGNMNAMKKPMNAMMMKAMKMPIRAMKKMEDLVGGQKKLDKDKDGDLDAKDFAALRKTKSEAVKTGEADLEPKVKELNTMVKNPMNAMKDMKAMKDMNATYMAANVKAPVMNKGGADMAKVKDAPAMNDPMKKINATYGATKEIMNIAQDKNKMMKKETVERAHRYLETKPGSLEEAVLIARGLITEGMYEVTHTISYSKPGAKSIVYRGIVNTKANNKGAAEDKAYNKMKASPEYKSLINKMGSFEKEKKGMSHFDEFESSKETNSSSETVKITGPHSK